MLVAVSKTVLFSMYTSLVAICFSASAQLVCSDLLSRYDGGGVDEVAQETVMSKRQDPASKTSAAGRPKYYSHLGGSGRHSRL
jgi:hypothetical protein